MSRRVHVDLHVHAALLAGGATVGLGSTPTPGPGVPAWLLDAVVLALGGLALLVLAGRVTAAHPPGPAQPTARPAVRAYGRPERLTRLRRDVDFATHRAIDLYRLRPLVRAVAAHRLATGHAVDLDADPDRARELLGPQLWVLARAYPILPADRHGPGIPLDRLAAIVQRLEAL